MAKQKPIKTFQCGGWRIRLYENRLEATTGMIPGLKKTKTILYSNIAHIETGQFTNTTTITTGSGDKIKFPSRKVKNNLMEVM